jgi:GH15 family glucan-1,4-alpha-glucosidase
LLARAFVVGNGSVLATGDRFASLRELYAPSIAPEHQLLRRPARIGIAIDGAVRWLEDGFEARPMERGDAPIVGLSLVSDAHGIEVWIETFTDPTLDIVVRRVQVTNLLDGFRDLRLLFHHDLALAGGLPHEAAFHDPICDGVAHRSGRRCALIRLEGPEGGAGAPLWRLHARAERCEAGAERLPAGSRIEGPPEVRGLVDSLGAVALALPPGGAAMVTATLATAGSLEGARATDAAFREVGVARALARTRAHWNLWMNPASGDPLDLPDGVSALYRRSLVLLRLHQSPSGAIVSGVEAEPEHGALAEYRWCWHRDAALAADALGRAGYSGATRRYLEFAARSVRENGAVAAVVDPSGAPAPAPFSPEAPALLLWALARHFERERDVEFVASLYRDLAAPAAELVLSSIDAASGLPESPGPWEARPGGHAAVAAAVRGGLLAGARLAAGFGEADRARAWSEASDQVARGMARNLYRSEWGRFARTLTREGRIRRPDATLDASLLWIGLFDDFEPEDPKVVGTVDAVRRGLWIRTGVGGLARFERDPLGAVGTTEVPGSPWVETTLWLAQHAVRASRRVQDLEAARTLLLWCAARAEDSGYLPERLHPYRGANASPTPSMAAHTWFARTVADYLEKLRDLRRCERCGAAEPERREPAFSTPSSSFPGLVRHLD